MEHSDVNGHAMALPPSKADTKEKTPFSRHPVRWTVAAGGLAAMLALGGYGVTQAAASSATGSSASAFGGVGNREVPGGFSRGAPGGAGGSAVAKSPLPESSTASSPTSPPADNSAGGTAGIITAVSENSITLRTQGKGVLRVVVTSTTEFTEGTADVARAAVRSGDFAMVIGSTSSDGTVTAKAVTFGSTPNGAPGIGASAD